MDSNQEVSCTAEIEKYLAKLVEVSTVFLTQAKEHQPQYELWMNVAECAKQRWESYRYSTEPDEIRRCQGELDSLNCALYMCQLSRKTKNLDVKNKQNNPEKIVEELRTYIQSIGLNK